MSFKVVLVEDGDDSRQMLQSLLQIEGFDVDVAANGREGLELILRTVPRVAFVDIGLPQLNGYEVAQRVRESLGSDRVYLVALTGYGRESDRHSVLKAGFDRHLVKPFQLDDLIGILREVGNSVTQLP